MNRAVTRSVVGCAVLMAAASTLAGPLDPPPGPIVPTFKTLTDVEPRIAINATNTPGDATCLFRISQPGSYYLTENTGAKVANVAGIKIAASNVTIDMMGFTLTSVFTSLSGIVTEGSRSNITIRNGNLSAWDSVSVDLTTGGTASGAILENLRVTLGSQAGINAGNDATIRNCTVLSNNGIGINAGSSCLIADCIVRGNSGNGIVAGSDAIVRDCSTTLNAGTGITTGQSSTVANCTARSNAANGIVVGATSTITSCTGFFNGLSGIVGSTSAVITDCNADNNGSNAAGLSEGIFAGAGSTISNCTSQNNTSTLVGGVGDIGMGFRTLERCTVTNCTASRNRGHGFRLLDNSRISGCTSNENGSGSTISAGIYVTGTGTRVDDNQTSGSDFGIQAINAGNSITRNTARNNGINFNFVPDNIYGPIVDRRVTVTIPSTPAVNGSTAAASTLGSTDASANFSY